MKTKKVYIPHRMTPDAKIARILNAGMATSSDVERYALAQLGRGSQVDWDVIVNQLLNGRDVPWTEDITGKLQLAVEGDDGAEIVEVPITDGVARVPVEHVDHVLAGVHGSRLVR